MQLIKTFVLCALPAALVASSASAQNVMEGGRKLSAELSGGTTGDSDGSGQATVVVNPGQQRICYTLTVTNISDPTASHIHFTSTNGLAVGLTAAFSGSSEGCVDVSRDLALQILKDPGAFYVNVHNADYPAGAVNGTLGK